MNPLYRAFLARCPILAGLFLVIFPVIVLLSRGVRQVFGGLFDLEDFLGFFWATCFAYLFSWSITVILRITLIYGPERVGFARPKESRPAENDRAAKILFFAGLLMPASFIVTSFVISEGPTPDQVLGLAAGFLTALVIVFIADVIQRVFNVFHGDRTDAAKRLLFPFASPAATWAEESRWVARIFEGSWATTLVNRLRQLDPRFGQGYIRRTDGQVIIYPGHILAIVILSIYLVLYLSGVYFWNHAIRDESGLAIDLGISTLTYVFVLATLLLFLLSAVAFFFDRFRVPPLLVLILVVFFSDPDHRYEAVPLAKEVRPSPEEVFAERKGEPFIILVSAIGGGIQTASWASEILTGLDEACRTELAVECSDKIALISSVSGGSVGAMFFMERYLGDTDPNKVNQRIRDYASGSSLEFVGGSIVFDDLPRQIPTVSRVLNMDRGQHLARGWTYNQERAEAKLNLDKRGQIAAERLLSDSSQPGSIHGPEEAPRLYFRNYRSRDWGTYPYFDRPT